MFLNVRLLDVTPKLRRLLQRLLAMRVEFSFLFARNVPTSSSRTVISREELDMGKGRGGIWSQLSDDDDSDMVLLVPSRHHQHHHCHHRFFISGV